MLRLFFAVFGEFQAPPIGWNMTYSVLSHLQWICSDAYILETMPRKTGEKEKKVLVRVDEAWVNGPRTERGSDDVIF